MKRFDYYKKAKKYLQEQPLARKVENRAVACWNLLKLHQNSNLEVMDKQSFIKYFHILQGFDRAIRQVQLDCKELSDPNNDFKRQRKSLQTIRELGY